MFSVIEEIIYQIEHFKKDSAFGVEGVSVRAVTMATYVSSIHVALSEKNSINDLVFALLDMFEPSIENYFLTERNIIINSVDSIFTNGEYYRLGGLDSYIPVKGNKELENAFWSVVRSSFSQTMSMENTEILMSQGLLGVYEMFFPINDIIVPKDSSSH